MRQSWKIGGVYADWTMTVDIAPPDEECDDPRRELTREPDFRALVGHFHTLVEMNEALEQLGIR